MCGRFAIEALSEDLARRYGLEGVVLAGLDEHGFTPRYNLSPTELALVVADTGAGLMSRPMQWWYVPPWSSDPESRKFSTFNARDDKVGESKMYRSSWPAKRCIVPVSGFFEWKGPKGSKTPLYIQLPGEDIFSLAGLWSLWKAKDSEREVYSFTVITTEPNDFMKAIHNRMPVILKREDEAEWLDQEVRDKEQLGRLLTPYPGPMKAHAVSRAVNKPGYDAPECIAPADQ